MYTIQPRFRTALQPKPTNPYKRSTLPDRAVRNNPISCMREHFSFVESYDLPEYQSRAFLRDHLCRDHHFSSSSAFHRRTGFRIQTGVDRSCAPRSLFCSSWRCTPTHSGRLDWQLFARHANNGRTGARASSGPRDLLRSATEPTAGAASNHQKPINRGRQVSDLLCESRRGFFRRQHRPNKCLWKAEWPNVLPKKRILGSPVRSELHRILDGTQLSTVEKAISALGLFGQAGSG